MSKLKILYLYLFKCAACIHIYGSYNRVTHCTAYICTIYLSIYTIYNMSTIYEYIYMIMCVVTL